MNEVQGELNLPIQETEVPERNLLERFDKFWYLASAATHPSRIPGEPREIKRSLLNRAVRAELLRRFLALPKQDRAGRQRIIAEARDRDEIARRYLNQGEITVTLPDLGPQTSRLLVLEPPESRTTPETKQKPPIYFIPSISADIDPVGGFVQELAFLGRKVVVIGYPESSLGKVTEEFAKKATESKNYEPHTSFFKSAIRRLAEDEEIELWANSTGCPIVAEILSDPDFQERISGTVLTSPAGCVDQSRQQLYSGLVYEVVKVTKRPDRIPVYSLVWGRKAPDLPQQGPIKDRTFQAQIDKDCRQSEAWGKMRVKSGGQIIIWSGGNDHLTKSYLLEPEVKGNPQVTFLKEAHGLHGTPLIEPQRVLADIFSAQETNKVASLSQSSRS